MDSIVEQIERFFEEDSVEFDEGGFLARVAELMPERAAALLFLARPDGSVKSANHLDSSLDLMLAKVFAARMFQELVDRDQCAVPVTVEGESYSAFGLRFSGNPGGEFLGGLLKFSGPEAPPWLGGLTPALAVAGRLAWQGTLTDQKARMQRARIQHLLAEHETLKAAHMEATISAIEEHERRLRQEQEKLAVEQQCAAIEAANQAKSQFLANMSHEIRTPLTAILGFAELLRERGDRGSGEERHDYLNTIHTSAVHLLDLINDILDLSKIEAGRMQVDKIPCSPHEIVSSVLSLMRVRAKDKGLRLTCEWPDGVPTTILTDPLRLKQLLMNLVGNAIKFTHRGQVRLVCRIDGGTDKSRMAFDVIDTGIGIAREKLESIFDAFVQADNSVTREFGGTGLGLAISRHIARALGGDLTVRSEADKGSVFTATVEVGSLAGIAVAAGSPSDAMAPQPSAPLPQAVSLQGRKVLLVDDGSTNRKLISLFLRTAGADVTTAENGQMGLELASEHSFDAIVMDMQMPVMDGYTATRRLRELGLRTPIVALTAHAMSRDREKCLQAGCSAYLSKPVDSQTLLRTIADATASAGEPVVGTDDSAESAPASLSAQPDDGPLVSTLPTDDPEYREIVEDFVVYLKDQLTAVRKAIGENDAATIARIAHSLKGTSGNVGFDAFTEPAKTLEHLAKNNRVDEIAGTLKVLEGLAGRVVI